MKLFGSCYTAFVGATDHYKEYITDTSDFFLLVLIYIWREATKAKQYKGLFFCFDEVVRLDDVSGFTS